MGAPAGTAVRRSAFAASFLSLIFPGLGQAYAGAPWRGLLVAAPGVMLLALVGGLVADHGTRLSVINSLLDTNVLFALLVADVLLLLYRVVAIIDAYRVATRANTGRRSRPDDVARTPLPLRVLSAAGLLVVLLVASGVHVAVAYYDRLAYDLISTVTSGSGGTGSPSPSPTEEPTGSASPSASATPVPTGGRLNILLLGVDRRGNDVTFNTDTMIVLSIDPKTDQIAMLSLPRDTVNVPLPRQWPAYSYYGGVYPAKINSLWTRAVGAPALFPFSTDQRGPAALKGTLGTLYGIDIPYYVEVDFDGFRRVVDTLGGVTVKVDLPVQDDGYPLDIGRGGQTRLYIPPTVQHMTGDQALAYARSRHGSNDFDRAARQQNVLISLRQQADIPTILANLADLVNTLKTAVHTDIPTSMLPQLAAMAEQVGLEHVRSLVFAPPLYGHDTTNDPRGYIILPNVTAIRQAVKNVFSFDPALEASREKIAAEGATVRILNGSTVSGQAVTIKDYLVYRGFDASVPTTNGGRASRQDYTNTIITVYNGAEATLPATIDLLQQLFGVQVVTKTDPTVKVDIILITGASTPKLVAPT